MGVFRIKAFACSTEGPSVQKAGGEIAKHGRQRKAVVAAAPDLAAGAKAREPTGLQSWAHQERQS